MTSNQTMKSFSIFYFLLLFTFFPRCILAREVPESLSLINETCDHTLYKDLCRASLESVPESKDADLSGLAKIVLKIASFNATYIYDHIPRYANKTSDEYVKQCLEECHKQYQDAVNQIKDSIEALNKEGHQSVNALVTAAINDADSCEQGFRVKPGLESPLKAMSMIFSQFCSISLTIMNLLGGI